ncbi:thiamine-phosphate kinase [Candidatus Bathyarchaeota archaeon]|nr:MAG: thiamine-phosphate kinase [Candidatus Bathyarchaeota archaeon]
MKTARKLGEREIIEIMWQHLERAPNMSVPFGDDVSALDFQDNNLVVMKTDMLVGRTDVPPGMNFWQAARKAVVMNISDLASKGVRPSALLVSLGIRPDLTEEDVKQIAEGLNAGAREYGTYVFGGDTSETLDLIVSVAVFGLARKEKLMLRSGAQPGDVLATTGEFGLSASGLKILKGGLTAPTTLRQKLAEAVLMPRARLKEGLILSETGAVTSSIDSSDGLAWSLFEISRSSGVGFVVDNLPIAQETHEFARIHDLNPVELSLYGGEEYELVVTVKPELWGDVERAVKQSGGKLIRIGETTKSRSIFLKLEDQLVEIEARGYEHFRRGGSE